MDHLAQAFSNIDLDGGDGGADLEELLREDFSKKYDIPYDQAVLTPRGNLLSEPQRELLDETVQHLTDLGFLDYDFFEKYQAGVKFALPKKFARPILAALLAYLAEDEALQTAKLAPTKLELVDLTTGNDLLPLIVQRLNLLTSLDGEFTIDRPIAVGEQSIFSRVLLYRLNVYGQLQSQEGFTPQVSDRITNLHIVLVYMLEFWLGLRKRPREKDFKELVVTPEQFARTGNAHEIFRLYVKHHSDDLLFYKLPEPHEEIEARYEFMLVFQKLFLCSIDDQGFASVCREVNFSIEMATVKIKERGSAEAAARDLKNRLGVRLLQLKLWMYGFYFGRIDGEYGPLSHQAFLELLNQEEEEEDDELANLDERSKKERRKLKKKKRKEDRKRRRAERRGEIIDRDDCLLALDDGYCAVNLAQTAKLLEGFDQLLDQAEKNERELEAKIQTEQDDERILHAKSQTEVATFLGNTRTNGRRTYHGLKALVASAAKGIKRVARWIAAKVREIAGAVVSFLKNVFKRIREGVQTFFRAMRRFFIFVMRRPFISPENYRDLPGGTPYTVTRFDFDFDVINIHSPQLHASVRESHNRVLHSLVNGLELFLEIAGHAIRFISNLPKTPIGWVRLGIQLGKIVAELAGIHIRLPKVPLLRV